MEATPDSTVHVYTLLIIGIKSISLCVLTVGDPNLSLLTVLSHVWLYFVQLFIHSTFQKRSLNQSKQCQSKLNMRVHACSCLSLSCSQFSSQMKNCQYETWIEKRKLSQNVDITMRLLTWQVRLEAKIETLAEALEEKKKEYSIKEFEVGSRNTIERHFLIKRIFKEY